ncbi:MAG TPA: TlpA disulfide reductase family protein [Rhodocyclaceae bacterium]|nr:TlpA disulfide reductase family protein [Rhodocyclaceae bacterium]
MHRFKLLKLALAAAFVLGLPAAHALEVGKPVPDFSVKLADGKVFKPDDAKGEVLVVNLWATWCTFCRDEMPALETYYQRHKGEGLRVIAVSMDEAGDESKAREVMKDYSYALGLGRLSKLKALGRVWRLPMTFIIDRNGVLRKDGSEGEPKIDLPSLEREVTPLLKLPALATP